MNLLIAFYLIMIAPKICWERIVRGKRHPGFLQRMGFIVPKGDGRDLVWIHAVSVGEVKAAAPLLKQLKIEDPNRFFLITTTSFTGQMEARRSLTDADALAYLPLDLSFVVKRWVKSLNPKLFILVESDFWPNLLKALKNHGTKTVLVSGKMSSRSFKRLQLLPFFGKKLFSYLDLLCLQNEIYFNRFSPFVPNVDKLVVTGNLKLDLEPRLIKKRDFLFTKPVIVVSCTHAPEEELILDAIGTGEWTLVVAPRHPERFKEVAAIFDRKKISYSLFSRGHIEGDLLLIDQMGELAYFYSIASLTIVAGSYVDHIGGHNVLEPCLYDSPVIFGPHMFGQEELRRLAIESGVGKCVELKDLRKFTLEFFQNPQIKDEMKSAATRLIQSSKGAALKTVEKITCA